jgi:hypothetical protein
MFYPALVEIPSHAYARPGTVSGTTIIFLHKIERISATLSARGNNALTKDITCEIGISDALHETPKRTKPSVIIEGSASAPAKKYTIALPALRVDERAHILFDTGITNVTAGLLVELKQRRSRLVLDVQPRFILPSGHEDAFNPNGVNNVRQLLRHDEFQIAAAKSEITRLARFREVLAAQLRERLASQIKERELWVRQDRPALEELRKYWFHTAKDESIRVRISSGITTLPVDVEY